MFLEESSAGEALDGALAGDVVAPLLHVLVLDEEALAVVLAEEVVGDGQALVIPLIHVFLRA